ncbi:hypothetical protein Ciccas_006599 [Cichlidogyrus casuarinus]|uniref:Uncharacterized protein n=1 Tax=Cichlidogyrus casuarinus TaxID=1844966 RepID=A0ABD2Q6C5_9PLAT
MAANSSEDVIEVISRRKKSTVSKDKAEYLIELSRLTEQRINLLICHYENYIKLLSCPFPSLKCKSKASSSKFLKEFDSDDEEELEIQSTSPAIASASTQLETVVEVSKGKKTPPLGEPPLFPTLKKSTNIVNYSYAPEEWPLIDEQQATSTIKRTASPVLKSLKIQPPLCSRLPSSFINKTGPYKDHQLSEQMKDDPLTGLSENSRFNSKVSFLNNLMTSVLEEPKIMSADSFDSWDADYADFATVDDINESLDEDIDNLLEHDSTEVKQYAGGKMTKSRLSSSSEKRRSFEKRLQEMQAMKEKVRELKQQMLLMRETREKRVDYLRKSRANPSEMPSIVVTALETEKPRSYATWVKDGDTWCKRIAPQFDLPPPPWTQAPIYKQGRAYLDLYSDIN